MLLPTLLVLRRKINFNKQKSCIHCGPLIDIFISNLEKRFDEFLSIKSLTSETPAIALYIPTVKTRWMRCIDTKYHDRILTLFKGVVIKVIPVDFANINTPSPEQKENEKY